MKSDVDALYWVAKSIELSAVMDRHPATRDLMAYQIEGLDFALSIEAIAQHYQYPTQLLDFSRSRDVAMFFATCAYDQAGDIFLPLQ
ncbi:MAG: FRG domain-containing protein [Pseudomonadota bacterium]